MTGKAEEISVTRQPESAQTAFLAWEKFRFVYNLILVGVVLIVAAPLYGWSVFGDAAFWEYLAFGCFAANVCFCVGPWIEGWLALAGGDRRVLRLVVFVPGMVLACILTGAALLSWHFQGTD
jgi:hypothetical protein